ncbi:MAG: imidazole glycerol phosphate synthase subunit HisH [Chitinophagaceae bacterium]|nr:MAG: imidazole glycerol phosphate synthase subunit HisH [Chitinophagaceae bacterium]
MVSIIDYGLGNLASVQKALNKLSIGNVITDDHSVIRSSRAILLPGVGSFQQGMQNLRSKGLDRLLTEEVMVNKKKFLGICLGMQLVATHGTEPVDCEGLGWVTATVKKIERNTMRIPHLGWNDTNFSEQASADLGVSTEGTNYYFIHSYQMVPDNRSHIIATADYGGEIVAGIRHDNILAFQFHPEKSQATGLHLLQQYLSN